MIKTSLEGRPAAGVAALAVQYLPTSELRGDPANARLHTDRQVRQLSESIRQFGFNVPILIDQLFNVIAGHCRLAAARKAGLAEVPCIRLDHLTAPQRKAFMIADNRLAEIATWDDRLLAEQLKALSEVELDFDLEVIGFDVADIDLRIESLRQDRTAPVADADDCVPALGGAPISRPGDLWLLGRHRVLCGDACESTVYERLMGADRAAAVFTDPPYNLKVHGHVSGLGRIQHREFAMASGEMTQDEFTAFLFKVIGHLRAVSQPGGIGFVCMDWRHIGELMDATRRLGLDLMNVCVWAKPNGGMGSLYRSQHELAFVLKLNPGRHRNNVKLGAYGRNRSNLWTYGVGPGFGRAGEEGNLAVLHPTVKPVAMIADAILDVTRRGDFILDPFLGSGSTVIAAERVGRRAVGIEIDPLYVDVIIRRWESYSGAKARLAATGQDFLGVARARDLMPQEDSEALAANGDVA
jgi:DNA modification methylase